MHVLDAINRLGIRSHDHAVSFVSRSDVSHLMKLDEELAEACERDALRIRPRRGDVADFSFWPSGTLSGEDGACGEAQCRQVEVDKLLRYAALWADLVYLPNYFGEIGRFTDVEIARERMLGHLGIVLSAKESLLAGTVAIAPTSVVACQEFADAARGKMSKARTALDTAESAIADQYASDVKVVFETHPGHVHCVSLEGPEDLIPHGAIHYQTHGDGVAAPDWLPDHVRKAADGNRPVKYVVNSRVRKSAALSTVIQFAAEDALISTWYNHYLGTKYLTERRADHAFLQAINGSPHLSEWTASLASSGFPMPLLADVPLSELLAIRSSEPDSFLVYRSAVARMIKDRVAVTGTPLTADELKEIFRDEVQPQLDKMNQRLATIQESLAVRFMSEVAVIGLMTIVAVTSAIVFQEPLAAAAGSPALPAAADAVRTIVRNDHADRELSNENFYFLWRLSRG